MKRDQILKMKTNIYFYSHVSINPNINNNNIKFNTNINKNINIIIDMTIHINTNINTNILHMISLESFFFPPRLDSF